MSVTQNQMPESPIRSSRSAMFRMTAGLAVVMLGTLVGCSSSDSEDAAASQSNNDQSEVQSQSTSASEGDNPKMPSPTKGTSADSIGFDESAYQKIDVQRFSQKGIKAFYVTLDGKKSECFYSDGAVTCIGKADSSIPDVEVPPFPPQSPGAIMLNTSGAAYTLVEGVPPAQEELDDGQWTSFGTAACAKTDANKLVCQSDNAAFAIEGKDRNIRTSGKVFDSVEELMAQGSEPARGYSQGTDALVQGPMMCGAMEGHRLAEVVKGEMTCAEAMDVLDRYDAIKDTEGGGNTLTAQVGDWTCSSPTAARSEELGAVTVCEDPERGLEVRDPVMG